MKIGPASYVPVAELDKVDEASGESDRTYRRVVEGRSTGTVRVQFRRSPRFPRRADFHVEVRGEVPKDEVRAFMRAIESTVRDVGGITGAWSISPGRRENPN